LGFNSKISSVSAAKDLSKQQRVDLEGINERIKKAREEKAIQDTWNGIIQF
jgi:SAM-dependent MidA family methyltransferase